MPCAAMAFGLKDGTARADQSSRHWMRIWPLAKNKLDLELSHPIDHVVQFAGSLSRFRTLSRNTIASLKLCISLEATL
jgi:hypothetical protein